MHDDPANLLVFMDECGDHAPHQADTDFPILVLAFVIIQRADYTRHVIPSMAKLKLRFWHHEGINLHSRDIRKQVGDFRKLHQPSQRLSVLQAITHFITDSPFKLIISAVRKSPPLPEPVESHPYQAGVMSGLKLVLGYAATQGELRVHLVAEARGKREDNELTQWIKLYQQPDPGQPYLTFEIRKKSANIAGLQLADLCAYPAARRMLNPDRPNPAYDCIAKHLAGLHENKKGGPE